MSQRFANWDASNARSSLSIGSRAPICDAGPAAILLRDDMTRVLASEGGRTSRGSIGSIGNMREYVAFLNRLNAEAHADLDAIESFWIARVHEFFATKPFRIRLDASRSLRTSCATCWARPKTGRRKLRARGQRGSWR